jgi:hypothetical protein
VTDECAIQAAVRAEFGPAVEYRRLGRFRNGAAPMAEQLPALDAAAKAGQSFAVVVPARPGTAWAHDYCFPWEVRFLRGRVRFPGEGRGGAPFPSMVVAMGPPAHAAEARESVR